MGTNAVSQSETTQQDIAFNVSNQDYSDGGGGGGPVINLGGVTLGSGGAANAAGGGSVPLSGGKANSVGGAGGGINIELTDREAIASAFGLAQSAIQSQREGFADYSDTSRELQAETFRQLGELKTGTPGASLLKNPIVILGVVAVLMVYLGKK